jgi:hypothetical protein
MSNLRANSNQQKTIKQINKKQVNKSTKNN